MEEKTVFTRTSSAETANWLQILTPASQGAQSNVEKNTPVVTDRQEAAPPARRSQSDNGDSQGAGWPVSTTHVGR